MAASVPALKTSGLSAAFGGLIALSDVSMEVPAETIVSIIGPNGAGKSTLLNGVSRLIRTTGTVSVFGQDVTAVPAPKLSSFGVARTFQDPQLVDTETVLENILSGTYGTIGYSLVDQLWRRGKVARLEQEAVDRAMELLRMVGLAELANRKCSELAYGPRKLIDILRALIARPRLVLLDEPSSGLDTHERKTIEKTLSEVHAQGGVALLVVEHHMDLVRAISHKVVALQTGSILIEGTPAEVLESQGFRKAMVGGDA